MIKYNSADSIQDKAYHGLPEMDQFFWQSRYSIRLIYFVKDKICPIKVGSATILQPYIEV